MHVKEFLIIIVLIYYKSISILTKYSFKFSDNSQNI